MSEGKSTLYRLGQASGRLMKIWTECIVEFSQGFQEEAGDIEEHLQNAFKKPSEPKPEDS